MKRGIDSKVLTGTEEGTSQGRKDGCEIIRRYKSRASKKIVKEIKDMKMKVQPQIQDIKRVNGKKIDDLQAAIAHPESKDMGVPLQFVNFNKGSCWSLFLLLFQMI